MNDTQASATPLTMTLATQTKNIVGTLVDQNGNQNLYIGDETYTAYLVIRNENANTAYGLVPPSDPQGSPATNAHFTLAFSADILLAEGGYPVSGSPDWLVTPRTATNQNGQTLVSLLYVAYIGSEPLTLQPLAHYSVPILYQSVSSYTDSTECSITLSLINLTTLWNPAPPAQQGISITEDITTFTFQLIPQLVGVASVFNDGHTNNSVILRMINPTTSAIVLSPNSTLFKL
ncbi:MAG: hypothetical protein MUC99_12900, partial [Anaerolineae bacterium]|nr:hypothetical protein [Anaerolineae bacterium]